MTRIDLALSRGRFRALTFGDPAAPPLVWLHGFPDHPPTAESLLSILSRQRYVIAPWLRGYAPSTLDGPFDLETLAEDVIAMIDHVGRGPVDLVGHDWGGIITYAVCTIAPERVRRASTLAVPHPLTFLRSLLGPRQATRSWYMALFQLPYAEELVRARDLALIDQLWERWSPGYELPEDRRRELHECLAASLPAPLAYYRAIIRAAPFQIRRFTKRIETPLLQLHGADDGCIATPPVVATARDAKRFRQRELAVLPGAGHFLHLEQPATVAGRVMAWLS